MADNETHKPYELERRGLLFVLSSPAGAGKSTLSRMLLDADENIALSVSYTTRPPRPAESQGVLSHFTHCPSFIQNGAVGQLL